MPSFAMALRRRGFCRESIPPLMEGRLSVRRLQGLLQIGPTILWVQAQVSNVGPLPIMQS